MPSTEKFRDYVLAQFKGELRVTTRKMMGEYILYADGKIFGGIYDEASGCDFGNVAGCKKAVAV